MGLYPFSSKAMIALFSVSFISFSLTSVISNSILIEADISRKKRKKKVDSIAAQIILQDYLNKEKNKNE